MIKRCLYHCLVVCSAFWALYTPVSAQEVHSHALEQTYWSEHWDPETKNQHHEVNLPKALFLLDAAAQESSAEVNAFAHDLTLGSDAHVAFIALMAYLRSRISIRVTSSMVIADSIVKRFSGPDPHELLSPGVLPIRYLDPQEIKILSDTKELAIAIEKFMDPTKGKVSYGLYQYFSRVFGNGGLRVRSFTAYNDYQGFIFDIEPQNLSQHNTYKRRLILDASELKQVFVDTRHMALLQINKYFKNLRYYGNAYIQHVKTGHPMTDPSHDINALKAQSLQREAIIQRTDFNKGEGSLQWYQKNQSRLRSRYMKNGVISKAKRPLLVFLAVLGGGHALFGNDHETPQTEDTMWETQDTTTLLELMDQDPQTTALMAMTADEILNAYTGVKP